MTETGRLLLLLAGLSHIAAFLSWWEEHTWKLKLEKTEYLISQGFVSIQCRRLAVCSVFVMHSALLMAVTVISAYYRWFCPIRRESNGSGTFRKTHTSGIWRSHNLNSITEECSRPLCTDRAYLLFNTYQMWIRFVIGWRAHEMVSLLATETQFLNRKEILIVVDHSC